MRMRVLAGVLLTTFAIGALAAPAAAEFIRIANSPAVIATAPARAAASRTYPEPMDALIAADLDYLVTDARRAFTEGDRGLARGMLVFLDDMAAGRNRQARQTLTQINQAAGDDEAGDYFEPFLLVAEGQIGRAIERADDSEDSLPAPLPAIMRALVYESGGRLNDAARVYGEVIAGMDVSALPEGEPDSMEELQRVLSANRTTHTLYRAALVQHRLRNRAEAERLYGLVKVFAPHSPDVEANLARLAQGQAPLEPALDARRGLGRWLTFLSDYLGQTEGIAAVITADGPITGIASPSSAMFLQFALALDPSADDWRLVAAGQVMAADGYDGAERLVAPIRADSPYGAEAELTRAVILLHRREDQAAAAAAARAQALNPNRWSVLASVGDIFRSANRPAEATAAFDRALALVDETKDRASVLRYRAYAHRFAGDVPAAVRDARAALEIDQSDDTRLMFVSILMDDSAGWTDAIAEARNLFAERPDSVTRLNTLGYALIQKPEGLEEGYRLLWRGFLLGERDYAVIDSLGWAYYHHGAFEQARALIERANDLTGNAENAEIIDHLGDVYWRLGRQDEARTRWREALAARPDAIRARVIEQKIEHGMRDAAPRQRELPNVELPSSQRDNT